MSKSSPTSQNHLTSWIVMTLFVVILWGLSAVVILKFFPTWDQRGTVGDMFGAVNALFSGLAFAALIYTIMMQREEISLNRQEITRNRKELKKATLAQQKSQQALEDQAVQAHISAKLNAMSTVLNYYNAQINTIGVKPELKQKAIDKRRLIIRKIDEMIDGLEDSDID